MIGLELPDTALFDPQAHLGHNVRVMTTRWRATVAVAVGSLVILTGCGSRASHHPTYPSSASSDSAAAPSASGHGHEGSDEPASAPLRQGERFQTVGVPADYQPTAQNGGTDDYRCFLLDPKLTKNTAITGSLVLPDNADIVHHAILYRVLPSQVSSAKELDGRDGTPGWECFGDSLIPAPEGANALDELDNSNWLAAWAPGGGEAVYPPGIGVPLSAGSQIVLQMHYNLRAGSGTDASEAKLRLSDGQGVAPINMMLLPGPVELPCAPDESGSLCDRENAIKDVKKRFGPDAGRTVAGLQLLCGGDLISPKAGSTQTCTRFFNHKTKIWAAAGHMHLLGRSLTVEVNPGTLRAKTILDIPVWDFDRQGAKPLAKPVTVEPGDSVRIRCTHDAGLRSRLPQLANTPPRYVVWGEGTTDEMCLGVLVVTRP